MVFSGQNYQECVSIYGSLQKTHGLGCQFINAHNKLISKVFNFNNNIQIGDASQVFYST